jgi:peptidoglycan/LPS O-acetylase OafA/YrhL
MEGLRGLAVTLVFLQHYSVQTELLHLSSGAAAVFARVFRAYGNLGVELFFVLSGFLIYGTLIRKAPDFTPFVKRRYQRIYPAFLVVFGLAVALNVLVPGAAKIPHGVLPAAAYLAANLALLPGLFPIIPIFDVAWSLSYEMVFYFATAAAVLGCRLQHTPRRRRVIGILVLAAAFQLAALAQLPNFPARMLPFFAGMLLAEDVGRIVPCWAGWALPLADFAASALRIMPLQAAEPIHTVAFFALCAVCFRDAGGVAAVMRWTPLRWLGNMSYSYYLLHGFVIRIGMVLLGRSLSGALPEALFWALMPLAYAATLLVSAALFVWVEKPFSLDTAPANTSRLAPNWTASGRERGVRKTRAHFAEDGGSVTVPATSVRSVRFDPVRR